MKEVSKQEIREIAENIVKNTTDCSSNYDAIENTENILEDTLKKMGIAVQVIKNNPNCKCTSCGCGKK